MAKSFNSMKDLEKYINQQMADVLQNEVAEAVKKEQSYQVEDEVYDKYSPSSPDGEPWVYERRRDNGGLSDTRNMITSSPSYTGDGVEVSIENITKGSDDNFQIADLVEYGDGTNGKEYEHKTNRDNTAYQYLRGRPFTKATVEELERTGEHIDAARKGLKRKGLDIE
jgi:hypothetical protein